MFLRTKNVLIYGLGLLVSQVSLSNTDLGIKSNQLQWKGQQAEISLQTNQSSRIFTLRSNANLRDGLPEGSQVRIFEFQNQPKLYSGHELFDGLFSLSIQETRDNSVSQIHDWAFDTFNCECFETGRKWNYVWTRDISYAVDLSLGLIDPKRAQSSLDFKLSELRSGGNLQIVQDTGTGGSWPVSSDRVVWALGAMKLLDYIPGFEQEAYTKKIYAAFVNTIETDRITIYDARDGLYRGEQSFLDWREQSYASWTRENVVNIAMSKSLSTNALHYNLLSSAAKLATRLGKIFEAKKYEKWAAELKTAINKEFWLEDYGLYSGMIASELSPVPLAKFDLLGLSLTILLDIADAKQAERIIANYPNTSAGVPVIWPEQPFIPVYHNRGIWPFVTAYYIKAARKAGNIHAVNHNIISLVRGAALNLSNMENFEFLTLDNWYNDGAFSGPVINSQRQLWSVAGYTSMVLDTIFGKESSERGIRFSPFISDKMHRLFFKNDIVELKNIPYHGRLLNVRLNLPELDSTQSDIVYQIAKTTLNGKAINSTQMIDYNELQNQNELVIDMVAPKTQETKNFTLVEVANPYQLSFEEVKRLWAPKEPKLLSLKKTASGIVLSLSTDGESDTAFNIYRNGKLVKSNYTLTQWIDSTAGNNNNTVCYTIEQEYTGYSTRSHHSPAQCIWASDAIKEWTAGDENIEDKDASTSEEHGRIHYNYWGGPEQAIIVNEVNVTRKGWYYLQLLYGNAGPISTGITAATKRWEVVDTTTGKTMQSGVLVMPHLKDWSTWENSTLSPVYLESGKTYKIRIYDHLNMTYFKHFEFYKGRGGQSGIDNRINLATIKLLFLKEG